MDNETDIATDLPDPGPAAVDKILDELEQLGTADVSRQARRLRAHVKALREVVGAVQIADMVGTCGWSSYAEARAGLEALLP